MNRFAVNQDRYHDPMSTHLGAYDAWFVSHDGLVGVLTPCREERPHILYVRPLRFDLQNCVHLCDRFTILTHTCEKIPECLVCLSRLVGVGG